MVQNWGTLVLDFAFWATILFVVSSFLQYLVIARVKREHNESQAHTIATKTNN